MAGKSKPQRKPPQAKKQAGSKSAWLWAPVLAVLALGTAIAWPHLRRPHSPPPAPRLPKTVHARGCGEDAGPEDDMCLAWHKAGYCRGTRPATGPGGEAVQVPRRCPRTCGLCPGTEGRTPRVPREDRCRRDNRSAAVPAKALNAVFERILAEFPEYEPTALSTSPYVLHLKNFMSEDEAAAFPRVCASSFERSLAGDQLNPVRTSDQCWCNFPGCFVDPLVHRVTRRINNVTGTPYDNGEDLQIVRYAPNQFYKRHHDQNTAVWAPQGPRVFTFFMYLNDPEDGGETAFPLIPSPDGAGHLVVKPKLGHALLWPSVLHERPMEADDRTDHEAMPVHKGIKYGANMWIHQFSFKTPSERGCELTYVNTLGRKPQKAEHAALVSNGRVPNYEETLRLAGQ